MPRSKAPGDSTETQKTKKIRLLAFDFGLKRIGAATGNTVTGTTQALSTVPARDGVPDWNTMRALIDEWRPDVLLVGLPLDMDGGEGTMCELARNFGAYLGRQFRLPVEFVDERLTSVGADNLIRQPLAPGKRPSMKRIAAKDNLAAELILQTYLEDF